MPDHYYQYDSHTRRHRFMKWFKWSAVGALVAVTIAIPILFFTTSLFVERNQHPVISGVQSSVVQSSVQIFRSPFFQFQTDKTWNAVPNESTTTKFVYRKLNDVLVEAQLDIYVNEAADQAINATRVLPVTYNEDSSKLDAKLVSEPCAANGPKNRGYKMMTLLGVDFRCSTDATDYSVLIGKENGTTLLQMIRPDGTSATYVIHFRDLRAIPHAQDIENIVNSFQTR